MRFRSPAQRKAVMAKYKFALFPERGSGQRIKYFLDANKAMDYLSRRLEGYMVIKVKRNKNP